MACLPADAAARARVEPARVAARGRFEVVVAGWSVPGGDRRGVCVLNGAGCGSGILLRARRAARNRPWRVACTCGTRPVGRAGPPGSAS